jgi:hypothetical protein
MGAADWQAPLTSGPAPALRIYLPGASATGATPLQITVPNANTAFTPISMAPMTMLAGLSTGPVGGVRGSAISDGYSAPDRVLVQGAQFTPLASLVSLTVLTQASGFGSQPSSNTDVYGAAAPIAVSLPGLLLAPLMGDGASTIMRSCEQALDVFFSLEKWLESLPLPNAGARLVPDAPPAEAEDTGLEGLQAVVPPARTMPDLPVETRGVALSDWTWVGSLAVLGLGTFTADMRRSRRRDED